MYIPLVESLRYYHFAESPHSGKVGKSFNTPYQEKTSEISLPACGTEQMSKSRAIKLRIALHGDARLIKSTNRHEPYLVGIRCLIFRWRESQYSAFASLLDTSGFRS